ncbi:MAG TPA: hypothetical protein VJ795_12345 [Rheinheimera sp.]|uniref:hypothetical protein n=1 Tax=Rheinheimera sp. TaxID=1869214 RepID=UPI002B492F0B|nr:hypothetical protein [Rheinheimera sp.]HJS15855.1 hypothetical protein [Rheinheimera sp.]
MQILNIKQQQNSSSLQLLYSGRSASPERNDSSTVTKDNRSLTQTSLLPSANGVSDETMAAPADSTTDAKSDDGLFNAVYSIGTIKRLLEQLTVEELQGWVDPAELNRALNGTDNRAQPEQAQNQNATGVTIREWSYRYEAVSADFSGSVALEDGSSFSWSMQFAMSYEEFSYSERTEQPMKDPLVMSFNGRPVELSGQSSAFNLTDNAKSIQQLAQGQYYLAKDSNNNGTVDSGKELFGPTTGQGFAELATFDEDQNGLIDQQDPIWQSLWLWRPEEKGLYSLKEMGVAALSVDSIATPFSLRHKDEVQGRLERSSIFITEDKDVGLLQQIDLKV